MNYADYKQVLAAERFAGIDARDPFTWWSKAEQAQHRARLQQALDAEVYVNYGNCGRRFVHTIVPTVKHRVKPTLSTPPPIVEPTTTEVA